MNLIFFTTIPRHAIWGGTLIKKYFNYSWFPDTIGQSWSFSAQEEASNVVERGEYRGMTLNELWNKQPELFHSHYEEFPFIISLVAPEDDLSIQVHPNKEYAKKLGFKMGKNEAWYFIDASEDSNIVYGHNAADENEIKEYIRQGRWDDLIKRRPVKTGDFVYIPAGKLHALCKGNIVYEVQQSTNITYRFYDYHRKDKEGMERELHLDQAIACLTYRDQREELPGYPKVKQVGNIRATCFWHDASFGITRLEVRGLFELSFHNYQLATVVRGSGYVEGGYVSAGESFLIPYRMKELSFDGDMDIMLTFEGN